MNRETQRDEITQLETRVMELEALLDKKVDQIIEMQDKANESFSNSTDKVHMEHKIKMLTMMLESAEREKAYAEANALNWSKKVKELEEKLKSYNVQVEKNVFLFKRKKQ